MKRDAKQPGVQPFRTGVRAVLDREGAAEYVGVDPGEFWQLRKAANLPFVGVPQCRAGTLFRVRDLDRYLAEQTDRRWLPQERLGKQRELGTWAAARYLHLSQHQVRRLARLGEIPHEGGGQGVAYRFRVEDLDRCLDEWTRSLR